jgi:hypothetical protein
MAKGREWKAAGWEPRPPRDERHGIVGEEGESPWSPFNLFILASTQPVLILEDCIRVFMLLMDLLMRVPLPLKLHQQRAHMIHFQWRVPLTLKGLLGVREGSSTFLQRACSLALTCSAKMLESMRPIIGGWLKSFIGKKKIKRTCVGAEYGPDTNQ